MDKNLRYILALLCYWGKIFQYPFQGSSFHFLFTISSILKKFKETKGWMGNQVLQITPPPHWSNTYPMHLHSWLIIILNSLIFSFSDPGRPCPIRCNIFVRSQHLPRENSVKLSSDLSILRSSFSIYGIKNTLRTPLKYYEPGFLAHRAPDPSRYILGKCSTKLILLLLKPFVHLQCCN